MKKQLTMLMSALLCASALVLPACGGSSGSAGGGAAAEEKVDPKAKFIGTWTLAGAKIHGITMAGNIGLFLDGADEGINLTISEDGKCTLKAGENTVDATWELADDNTINMIHEKKDDAEETTEVLGDKESVPVVYNDGYISIEIEDEENPGSMIFTQDGTWAEAKVVTAETATEVADSAALVGEWKLVGVTMQGVCMYGSAEDLSSVIPTDADTSITINEDGSAKAMGQDVKWAIEDGKASLDAAGTALPLKGYDGGIALDMTDFYGVELLLLYSK